MLLEETVDFLNAAISQNKDAVNEMFLSIAVHATQEMCEHPTVQVRHDRVLTLLGLLNGLVGEGKRRLIMHTDDETNEIVRFSAGVIG